jgi:hypothetical protein
MVIGTRRVVTCRAESRLKWAAGRSDAGPFSGYVRSMVRGRLSEAVRAHPRRRLLAALVVAVLVASAGAKAERRPPESSPTPTRTVKVFFVKGEQFAPRTRVVPPGEPAARVAMQALLAGPSAAERAAGVETSFRPEPSSARSAFVRERRP